MVSVNSPKFCFLKADSPQLVRLGALAEHCRLDQAILAKTFRGELTAQEERLP